MIRHVHTLLLLLLVSACDHDRIKLPPLEDDPDVAAPQQEDPRYRGYYPITSSDWNCALDDPGADLEMPGDYPYHETEIDTWDITVEWPECQCDAVLAEWAGQYTQHGRIWVEPDGEASYSIAGDPYHVTWYAMDNWLLELGGTDGYFGWSIETRVLDANGSWEASWDTLDSDNSPMYVPPGNTVVQSILPPVSGSESSGGIDDPCRSYWQAGDDILDEKIDADIVQLNEAPVRVSTGPIDTRTVSTQNACVAGTSGTTRAYLYPAKLHYSSSTRAQAELIPVRISGSAMPSDAWVTRVSVQTLGSARNLYSTRAGTPFSWTSTDTLSTTGLTVLNRGATVSYTSGTQLGQSFASTTSLVAGVEWQMPQVTLAWSCPARPPRGAPATLNLYKPAEAYAWDLSALGLTLGAQLYVRPVLDAGYVLAELGGSPLTAHAAMCEEGEDAAALGCTTSFQMMNYTVDVFLYPSGTDLAVTIDQITEDAGDTFALAGTTLTLHPVE